MRDLILSIMLLMYLYFFPADIGITENPVSTAHLVGEDAVLSCTVKNPSGATPTLSWIKVDGDTETAQDNSNINFDNNNPGKSTLTFTSSVFFGILCLFYQ